MRLIDWFICTSMFSVYANAASFDCGKAVANVEKVICGDAELSRLDEELSLAYKSALMDKKSANILKESQKQWLKERDGNIDLDLIRKLYIQRLSLLKLPISTTKTGTPVIWRNDHSATVLPSGKVLIAGGWQGNYHYLDNAELYDPATGHFISTGKLVSHSRAAHLAILLGNGKVLVAGGEAHYEGEDPVGPVSSAEIYDPLSATFNEGGNFLPFQNLQHGIGLAGSTTATLLVNGKVLFARLFMTDSGSAELYDPSLGKFVATGSFSEGRFNHTATLLTNGKVLFVGGLNNLMSDLASAELYDPATGTFKLAGSLVKARFGHTATLLQNGKVLVAGGYSKETPIASAEIYDPATGRFVVTGSMIIARSGHTATLLQNGKVLIAGGQGVDGEPVNLELYDPITGKFNSAGRLIETGHHYTATLLLNGKVLFVGGGAAELYEPPDRK